KLTKKGSNFVLTAGIDDDKSPTRTGIKLIAVTERITCSTCQLYTRTGEAGNISKRGGLRL
ncbi:MAG: hypothetical protein UW82_C0050G0012, partial [candidate division WWE3 bacterium GW2011_GWC2_44_9]